MNKEWIRDKLLRAGTEVTDESNDKCDAVWLTIPRPSMDDVAKAIAAQHEAEVAERLAEWEESAGETENELIQEVIRLKAQVAVRALESAK